MSETLKKLESKLSRSNDGELILNIILGVWALVGCVCFITGVIKIHAVMIVMAIIGVLVIAVDGCFIIAIFYYKNKIKTQKRKEGCIR